MKKIYINYLIATAFVSLAILSSCRLNCEKGSGHAATESRKVSDFTKIDISGSYQIILKQDSSLNLSVTADDNLLKSIKTEVSSNKLYISTKKNTCNSGPMVITIGVRNIDDIASSGAIELSNEGKLTTKDLHFGLSGASKINLDLNAANVTTEASGATEMYLKGQASTHKIDVSGGGKVHAFDFVVGNYNIETSGAGEFEINVLHELEINSSGASSVKYKGNPTNIKNDKSGISSITKVD